MRDLLTKKYGPLPVWAWAAIGVAMIAIYRWMRSRNAETGPIEEPVPADADPSLYFEGGGDTGMELSDALGDIRDELYEGIEGIRIDIGDLLSEQPIPTPTGGTSGSKTNAPRTPKGKGIYLHGRFFRGARAYRRRSAGYMTTGGGWAINYLIVFPDRKAEWHYRRKAGVWRKGNVRVSKTRKAAA